jgi:hypothetical protein
MLYRVSDSASAPDSAVRKHGTTDSAVANSELISALRKEDSAGREQDSAAREQDSAYSGLNSAARGQDSAISGSDSAYSGPKSASSEQGASSRPGSAVKTDNAPWNKVPILPPLQHQHGYFTERKAVKGKLAFSSYCTYTPFWSRN